MWSPRAGGGGRGRLGDGLGDERSHHARHGDGLSGSDGRREEGVVEESESEEEEERAEGEEGRGLRI